MTETSPHKFHIPVLGICYTIDTPLKVARFGINSVVSIIEDGILEDMREFHSKANKLQFVPIPEKENDFRAKRITAYLNMMQLILYNQMQELKASEFTGHSDLDKYFQLLPTSSALRWKYFMMIEAGETHEKNLLQQELKNSLIPGSIDVNIMAKVDKMHYGLDGRVLPPEYSHALSALRGFANSNLSSSVVFSAGYNPNLYNYIEQFNDFYPAGSNDPVKKIILKVSDYRSAYVQGKIFAKKGLWVSEFRIESGLNCGGHAFPTEGLLMGPILEEFKQNRQGLADELYKICNDSLAAKSKDIYQVMPPQHVSAQGGVGTAAEQTSLLENYGLSGIGWGSPFLVVPEATNVDNATLELLASATSKDYYTSNASPLGIPFNNFSRSSGENQRKERIENGRPGSPCYKEYLASDTEFTERPVCTASRQYYHLKEKQLQASGKDAADVALELKKITEKDCLCEGLTAAVRIKNNLRLPHKLSAVTICPGPNLAWFSGVFTLTQMVDHIYGREVITNKTYRPHMFINELNLYVDYLYKQHELAISPIADKQLKYFRKFKENLLAGINYYSILISRFSNAGEICEQLRLAEDRLNNLV